MGELPQGKIIQFKDKEFNVSVADNGITLMRGLSGAESLEPYDGMLFDFGMNFRMNMWAKNLKFPLGVAFLSEEGVVMGLGRLDPEDESSFTLEAEEPGRYALEAPIGFFVQNDIKIGDKFDL